MGAILVIWCLDEFRLKRVLRVLPKMRQLSILTATMQIVVTIIHFVSMYNFIIAHFFPLLSRIESRVSLRNRKTVKVRRQP